MARTANARAATDTAVHIEKRRSERKPLVIRVAYATVDSFFSEFTRDINEGGLFIETEKPQEQGTEVSMQFNLPGSEEPIQTVGRVVHVVPNESGTTPGMGIEFDELGPGARARIDELIRALRSGRDAA